MTCRTAIDQRKSDLGKIHIAKKQLGMDDETYRDMLFTIARVRSAKDLDAQGRQAVLKHLRACGFKAERKRNYPGRPHNIETTDRGPMLKKIEAYLTEARRPWSYADGMAKKMFHVDRLAHCSPQQLHRIIAALQYDAKRNHRSTGR